MQPHATISIVTPAKDAADTIDRCLESCLDLRGTVIEHIVQDGGSTDGTREKLTDWAARSNGFVQAFFEDDAGIADAFNRGIVRAKGDWVGILNADDWYDPLMLDHVTPHLNREPSILHGMLRIHHPDGSSRVAGKKNYDPKRHFRPLDTMPAQHPTCLVRRDVYEKVGLFNTSYRIAMDYDFLLRAHLEGVKFQYIPEVITNFSTGGASSVDPLVGMREMLTSKKMNTGRIIKPTLWYFARWLKWRNHRNKTAVADE